MAFGDLQQLLRGAGRLAAALLLLLQGALRHAQRCGKLRLRESTLHPHTNDVGPCLNVGPFSFSSFDLPYAVQDFLPYNGVWP